MFTLSLDVLLSERDFLPLRLQRLDGTYLDVEAALTPLHGMGASSFLTEVRDISKQNQTTNSLRLLIENLEKRVDERTESLQQEISERKKVEEKLLHLASHDGLTGLPNRGLLGDRVTRAIANANRHKNQLALMFVDLDGFKAVNDTLGHEAGDEVLISVTALLLEDTRDSDTVARIGGDEFVIMLTDITDKSGIEQVAKKVVERLVRPIDFKGQVAQIGASIGIAVYPGDADDQEALLRCADQAMYEVKSAGKNNFMFYSDI